MIVVTTLFLLLLKVKGVKDVLFEAVGMRGISFLAFLCFLRSAAVVTAHGKHPQQVSYDHRETAENTHSDPAQTHLIPGTSQDLGLEARDWTWNRNRKTMIHAKHNWDIKQRKPWTCIYTSWNNNSAFWFYAKIISRLHQRQPSVLKKGNATAASDCSQG